MFPTENRLDMLACLALVLFSASTASSASEVDVTSWSPGEIRDDPDGALEAWRRATNRDDTQLFWIAQGFVSLGFVEEMEATFELFAGRQHEPEGELSCLIFLSDAFRRVGEFDRALEVAARARAFHPDAASSHHLLRVEAESLSRLGRIQEADGKFAEAQELGGDSGGFVKVEHQARAGRWEEVLSFWLDYEEPPGGCALGSTRGRRERMIVRSLFELDRHDEVVSRLAPRLSPLDPPGHRPGDWDRSYPRGSDGADMALVLRASLVKRGKLHGVVNRLAKEKPQTAFARTFVEVDVLCRYGELGDLDALCRFLAEVQPGERTFDRTEFKHLALRLLRGRPEQARETAWRHLDLPGEVWLTFLLADLGDRRVLGHLREVLDRGVPPDEVHPWLLTLVVLGGADAYDYLRSLRDDRTRSEVSAEASLILRRYPEGSNVRRQRLFYFEPR